MNSTCRRAALGLTVLLSGCNWLSLATNALTYDTLQGGDAGNVVVLDSLAYVTRAGDGIEIVNAVTGSRVGMLPPGSGSESVDDVAVADGLLFALDARPPGHLTVYSLADPVHPSPVAGSRDVAVGPFSGVSAADGLCIVSGGTSQLTVWRYDSTGVLSGPVATADLGRGQPDVLLGRHGTAYVSTHYWGPYFGLDVARVSPDAGLDTLATMALDGAGFTAGGARPANFPIEMALLDDSTLLVAYARGVAVVNVADPRRPGVRETLDVGGPAVNVDAAHGVAVVAVTEPAAVVFLDSAARVVRRVTLAPGTNPVAVAFSGARAERAVVAARGRGVLVVDRYQPFLEGR